MPLQRSRRAFLRRAASLVGAALALAGCGGTATSSGGSGNDQLIVWYESGLAIADALKTAIDRYNGTKPTVPVLGQPQPDLSIKLLVVIGAHDAPNVVVYPRSRAWSLVSRGAAFPLTDFAKRDGLSGAVFGPGFWEGGTVNGQLWGLPIGGDANVLAYNATLLAAAKVQPTPYWSTTAFNAACAALTQRNAQGHLSQTGAILNQNLPFEIWLWQQGADVLTPDGKSPAFDSQAGLKALSWLGANMQVNGGAAEIGRLVSLTTLTEGVTGVFSHGKLGLLPLTYGTFKRLKAQLSAFPIHLATLPTLDGGQPATLADAVYAFSPQQATDPRPEATWQFIKWLATNLEAQVDLFKGGTVPTLLQAQQSPTVAGDPDVQLMLQALKVARAPQDFSWEPEVAAEMNAVVPKILDGQLAAQPALDSASAQAKRTIEQDMSLGK